MDKNKFNGVAKTIKKPFSRSTTVGISIKSSPEDVWEVLNDISAYSKWNSTIISIEGSIFENSRIRLKSTLDPKRFFSLKVKDVVPNVEMVWKGNMGKREFYLEEYSGKTLFRMTETIGGPLFPLFSRMIPPFDESFEAFASDLKNHVELLK